MLVKVPDTFKRRVLDKILPVTFNELGQTH